MPKAIVVLSGGLDSTVVAQLVANMIGAENVHALTFDYGSKHNAIERRNAKTISNMIGLESHRVIELPFVNQLFKSDLLKNGGEIPEGHYADPSMKKTVVPFRNGIMLAIACGYAESVGAKKVYIGNHAGDHAIYPDCRNAFIQSMSKAMTTGTYLKVRIASPFCNKTKTEIARIGLEIGAPIHETYSCYKGGKIHCGKCGTCYERKEAFYDSGIKDLTKYEA